MMTTSTAETRQEKIALVHDQLIAQMESLVTSEDWLAFLTLASRFHNYSSNNCLLILAQCPDATRVASYTTWKTFGRGVRKGEKGISILAPCRYLAAEDSSKTEEGPKWKMKGFKIAYVFDVSQTEGDPLDEGTVTALLEGSAPEGMWDLLCTLIERDGYSVRRADCGAANGSTDRAAREVVVAPHLSDAASVKTLAHELAHVRQTGDHFSATSRSLSLSEVEAESVAYIVCNSFGLSSAPYSIGYVAGWAGGDIEVVKHTAAWVVKEAHRIIEESEEIRASLASAA